MLGQQHNYGYIDGDLIERYVCLGDDFEDDFETSQAQGRFADITKSAEVFMHRPELPMPLCIRDTPGVNDTFMIREQITIRAIRESRICVVVLAAHQALSSVDMALIRLIANVKSREVIIVVNRVDELSDPENQIPEIRDSIRRTLADHDGPQDAQLLFTSAQIAAAAFEGRTEDVDISASAPLRRWAEAEGILSGAEDLSDEQIAWDLSGLPSLFAALSTRIVEGVGRDVLEKVAKSAMNLANGMSAQAQIVSRREGEEALPPLEPGQLELELSRIETAAVEAMEALFEETVADFQARLDRSHRSFLERATGSLLQHLEQKGEDEVWQYDPAGLRLLLRTAYQVFGRKVQSGVNRVMTETARSYVNVYHRLFDIDEARFGIEAPSAPEVPSPVLLGQTIALDLKGGWWSKWWHKRRGYRNFATDFAQMIQAETQPIVDALRDSHSEAIRADSLKELTDFMAEQRASLMRVQQEADQGGEDVVAVAAAGAERREMLEKTISALTNIAA
jgi:hypothetical protein